MNTKAYVFVCLTLVGVALAADKGGKAAKSAPAEKKSPIPTTASTPTSTPTESAGLDMEVIDYIRSGAVLLAFVVACFAGREKWLIANTIIAASMGTGLYFFPKAMMDYQTDGSLDHLHLYLAQQIGALFIGTAVVTHYSRMSRSSATATTLLLTNALGGVLGVLCSVMDYLKAAGDKQRLNSNFLTFTVLAGVCWVLGSMCYAFRSSSSFGGGATTLRNRVSVHMFIDVFFLMMFGLMNFGYPENSLDPVRDVKFDGIHGHCIRAIGAMMIMGSLHGVCSLTFSDDKDKKIYLLNRITAAVFSAPVFFLYQWKYSFVTANYFYTMVVMIIIFGGNLLLGYFHPISLPKFVKRA